ncbi:MAG: hypothetical protein LUH05_06275, partial [Candidatus Gastranaerophilales bacterium]|nr:hypothetical protein [Candidatus Gastranaerophilales bacterium]
NYRTDSLLISALPLFNMKDCNIISISTSSDLEFMFSTLVILQILAFESAVLLGRNVDSPEGLTKIVK